MPRGKKKILHPPLTFLHPPFSKPLSEVVRVASSDQYPAVKTASTEEKCTWINPDFSLSTRSFFPKGGRRPPVQRNSPKPPLEFIEDPLDQVMTGNRNSEISAETRTMCETFNRFENYKTWK
ncbi:hypothetical protein CRM22_011301 [Opisthorchis felineus]|uniref:Uncharacterized protein n=1 Tax=Opisthorchis felineus TaxID=147828 RepID=A0A4S2JPV0_OPIFE|nr:hypothetical protein CRM22_011301 [Opisthorchis felineus]